MKSTSVFIKSTLCIFSLSVILFSACKKSDETGKRELDASKLSSICDGKSIVTSSKQKAATLSAEGPTPYTVSLLTRKSNGDGTYTWIWSVSNPNPGNGTNGTVQDLSHWGISLGACAKISDIVSASTSTNGVNWTSFTPEYKQDRSQDCYSGAVLKFDVGTSGTNKTYYKLVVNGNFSSEKVTGIYKSGNRTGCGTFQICGLGCL